MWNSYYDKPRAYNGYQSSQRPPNGRILDVNQIPGVQRGEYFVEQIPVHHQCYDLVPESYVEYKPVERSYVDYIEIQHQREYVPVQRVQRHQDYVPVDRFDVDYDYLAVKNQRVSPQRDMYRPQASNYRQQRNYSGYKPTAPTNRQAYRYL